MASTALHFKSSLVARPEMPESHRVRQAPLLDVEGKILIAHGENRFSGFGSSLLSRQLLGPLDGNPIPVDRLQARKMLRECCPATPGVYGWLDENQHLVYVGKSKTLQKRLLSYFAKTPSDKKMLRIRQFSHHLVWETVSDELLSLIREQELIFRFRPQFNVQGQPTRRLPGFVCLSKGPAPNAYFTRRLTSRAGQVFGPVAGAGHLRTAIESLNQVFQLRDCADKTKFEFNNQQTLFADPATAGCIRFELGSCPAPCAGLCSKADYRKNVDAAKDFLNGSDRSVLDRLGAAMKEAADKMSFERAASLRDQWKSLNWLNRRLTTLQRAQSRLNGVIPIATLPNAKKDERIAWLVLRAGRLMMCVPEPNSPERAADVRRKLVQIAAQDDVLATDMLETKLQLIVIAWLGKHPELTEQLIGFRQAIKIADQYQ